MSSDVPWSRLTSGLTDVLQPVLPEAVDETVTAIRREVPPYRRAWRADLDRTVRRGVQMALSRMLELLGTDQPALDSQSRRFYRNLGAGEHRQGRSLDALLSAYRTGARVNWETMSAAATGAGVATTDLIALAESIFVYIDELSSASAEGHASAEAASSGYRDVTRVRLAEDILAGGAGGAPGRLAGLADAAGWQIPRTLAVAVLPAPAPAARALPQAPPDVLLTQGDGETIAIIPDPRGPGRARALTRLVRGAEAYVGTVRPPAEAPLSLTHARRLRRLVADGAVPGGSVVMASRHLPELMITADPALPAELSDRALAPLRELSDKRRAPLQDTLASWLAHMGDRSAVAAELVVHPQTVSYRMARLQELFGDALADPEQRFALQLALRVSPPMR